MRTGLDFKSAQFVGADVRNGFYRLNICRCRFDHDRGEAEDWIKMRGLEVQSELEDLK